MIPVKEAIKRVQSHIHPLESVVIKDTLDIWGCVLAETILSPINMPPFRQSAMDGYAIHKHDGLSYNLIGEVKAGDDHQPELKPGEAVRIFTGAPVPDTANSVVIQENVIVKNKQLFPDGSVQLNSHIRPLGEQVKKGEPALEKGTFLTPAAIGYLSSLGIEKAPVYVKPKIAIVITGSELIKPGSKLNYGKIYESN